MEKRTGLTNIEVEKKRQEWGFNELPQKPPPSQLLILLDQFKNPLIYILILAAIITIFLRDFKDTIIIFLAVIINTFLGFLQENRAQKAIFALQKILTPYTHVIRNGEMIKIPAKELVVGDLVILNTGEKVPADGRLLAAVELSVDESILTGEAVPVIKDLSLKEKNVYMGTTVLTGRGEMEVIAIGSSTKLGAIATSLSDTKETETPLQKRIDSLAKALAIIIGILSVLILATGLVAGRSFGEMFITSVALAVAAIPEGLVVTFTVILAVGMQRIYKRKALVRRLLAAETLGSVTVICTDKTGTLTEGKFKVVSWDVHKEDVAIKTAVLCNNLADPEEKALWEFVVSKDHFDPQKIREENPRIGEIPFSSKLKFMITLNRIPNSNPHHVTQIIFVKGAPETVLKMCEISSPLKKSWEEKIRRWANKGERVIGMAYKQVDNPRIVIHNELKGLNFLGLVGFSDSPRKEAKDVLRIASEAGIKIKVLTGDFRVTAEAVLRHLGIEVRPDEIMEGEELKHLTLQELKSCVSKIRLFSRIDPSEKLRIVSALQENGEVVALIGDGVNDAPALKKAEVGVVVGEASEVAKETADIVLLDSNLGTLIAAIEEGRKIFSNLRKVVTYLLADAFSEVGLVIGAILLSIFLKTPLPLPLTAAQILWINLISDGFPSLALAVDPKEGNIMVKSPRQPQEAIINLPIKVIISVVSIFSSLGSLFIFTYFFQMDNNLVMARSLTFGALGFTSLLYVFSCRSLSRPFFKISPLENAYLLLAVAGGLFLQVIPFYAPFLQDFLEIAPLGFHEWGIIIVFGFLVVLSVESVKILFRGRQSS